MKENSIKLIKGRISRGTKYWEKENKTKFERFRRFLQIKHYPEDSAALDQITVPYIHAILRAKLPFLYYRNPEAIVTPKKKSTPEAVLTAINNTESVKSIMQYLPEEIGMEYEIKKAVMDMVSFGRGLVSIGFEYDIENPKGLINKTISKVKDFVSGKQTPSEEEVKILVDRFYIKRIAYPKGFFIYDPNSTDGLKSSRWCAEKIVEPLEDVKTNPKFKNTANLKHNLQIDKEITLEKNSEEEDEQFLEYYKYWEKNKYGVVTRCVYVVPDQNIILREHSNPYSHGDFPYEELDCYPIPDYLFPIGDIEPMETQQRELDLMESLQTAHARSFVQKYVYNKGKLSQSQLARLQEPINQFCEIDEESGLRALENPAVNQTIPQTSEMAKQDMTKIAGISDYDTAVIPHTETTLGEAQLVQGGANNRKEDARKNVEDFVKRVLQKLFSVVQQYMTEDMFIKVTGDGTAIDHWKVFTPEDIQGEFDFDIQPNSASPVNKDKLRQDNLLLYNTFMKDPTVPFAGKNQLRKWVLEAFDKKDANLFDTEPEDSQDAVDEQGNPIDGVPTQPPLTPSIPGGML